MAQVTREFQKSKKRAIVLLLIVVVFIALFAMYYFKKRSTTIDSGKAKLANVPEQAQFTPGSKKLSKQYLQTLLQSEQQKAQQALQKGQSSLPVLLNSGTGQYITKGTAVTTTAKPEDTCVECCRELSRYCKGVSAEVAPGQATNKLVDQMLSAGQISADVAAQLKNLAGSGASVASYSAALDKLVKEGKLTPEQAKKLLAAYRAEHGLPKQTTNDLVDQMLDAGQIPTDVATQLKNLSDSGASVASYSAALDKLVKEGKLTPAQAQELLASYRTEHGLPAQTANDLADQMLSTGQISADVAKQLKDLSDSGASVSDYAAALDKLVKEGKLTPDQAKELLAAYRVEHGLPAQSANDLVDQMANAGQISSSIASQLKKLSDDGVSVNDYAEALGKLVKEGKLTPAQSRNLLAAYRREHGLAKPTASMADNLVDKLVGAGKLYPEDAATLKQLSAEKALPSKYAAELNNLVKAGKLSPAEAQRLLSAYIAQRGNKIVPTGDARMDELKQTQEDKALAEQRQMLSAAQAQAQANVSAAQNEQQQLQNQQLQQMETAMQQQAQKLFTSWNVTPQQEIKVTGTAQQGTEAGSGQAAGKAQTSAEAGGAQYPFIKAGTIMFAVLDTAVNSDHPGPVMGTIVSGRLKGARIMGSLSRSKDRVILKFNMLTMKDWPETIGIDAVAINPDTAQTAIASDVDHHYLLRYGSLFAASFMSGYADAITNTGTTFYNTFGITVNNPDLSPKERFLVGLGEVGKNLASITKRLVNTPPTVRVSAGVGLGLLFTSDVKKEAYVQPAEGSSAGTQSGGAQQAASTKTAASSTSATEAEAETATKAAMSSDARKAMRSAAKTAGNANVIK